MHGIRSHAHTLSTHPLFERVVIAAILLNAVTLGAETYDSVTAAYGSILLLIDMGFIVFFVAELAIRITAQGVRFFRGGWNWFDFVIVLVTLLPFIGNLSALRALRILRVLRLMSVVPQFRTIVDALLMAARGAGAVFGLLLIIIFVFSTLSSKLFGTVLPEQFANLHLSMLTHFQLMVADNWSAVAFPLVAEVGILAGVYLVLYTVVAGLILLSMVVGVIIDAMQRTSSSVTNEQLLAKIEELEKKLIDTRT